MAIVFVILTLTLYYMTKDTSYFQLFLVSLSPVSLILPCVCVCDTPLKYIQIFFIEQVLQLSQVCIQ